MNKQATHEAILVMKAWIDGAEIQTQDKRCYGEVKENPWDLITPNEFIIWDFETHKFRIKLKPREFWVNPDTDRDDSAGRLHKQNDDCEEFGCIKVREVL